MKTVREVLHRSSKKTGLEAASMAESSDEFLEELLNLSLGNEKPFSWRASWAILYLAEKNPSRLRPHLREISDKLPELKNHTQLGSFLRMFDVMLFDLDDFGHLFDFCLHTIRMPQEREYLHVIAMNILTKFGRTYPELIPEILENVKLAKENFTMRHCLVKAANVLKEFGVRNYS